jgi:hypothetical protein
MSKSFTFRESCAKNLLGYKNLIGKVMDKSYAYYKRCAEKLSSESYAEKYYVIVILNKLYTYIRYNLLKIENHGKKLLMKGTPHAV